jgi:parallel beta helix pectate lyase-like protein
MRRLCRGVLAVVVVVVVAASASAATYYVDYDGGADTNVGTSADASFKHCPGDPAAGDAAKAVELAPGDTVILKGGVVYYGTIELTRSGQAGKAITLDGNSAGTFGQGRAVIDGSTPVTGWRRCASIEDAKGNPRWTEIFCADIPKPRAWRTLNLCDGEKPLPVAQDPNPSDPFFQEKVSEFHKVDRKMGDTFPGKVTFEKGSRGNSTTPLMGVISGGPAVVSPIAGGAFSVELNDPVTITAVGIKPQPRYAAVKEVAFYGDGKELLRVMVKKDQKDIQRFNLPAPVTVRKLTYKLLSAYEGEKSTWTKIARVAAYTADGTNVLGLEVRTVIRDEKILTQSDPHYYDGMWVGVHGGNNMIAYQQVKGFDPATGELQITHFGGRLYNNTKYCLYNSVRLIDRPGEYSVEPTASDKTWRIYLLPDKLEGGQPVNVAYSTRSTGISLSGASHVVVKGFLIRRQGFRRPSGISVRNGRDVLISDCEVTLVRGGAGIGAVGTDGIVVEKSHVHHCPGHTKGIVLRNCKNVSTRHCRLVKNTSTALDYYNCDGGNCTDNVITDHYGMHANGLTFYLGCKDIVIERNQVYDCNIALTIQDAENIVIRNNILDGGFRTMCVGIWVSEPFKNVQFLNNLLVRANRDATWQAGVFSNNRGPEGLVFRNNIIDGLSGNLPGTFEHNIYTRWGPNQKDHKLGKGEIYEPDLSKLFVDPEKRDFRPKPGSPAIDAGMKVDVDDDYQGKPRPKGKAIDIGAYEYAEE